MYFLRSFGGISEMDVQKEIDTLRKTASYQQCSHISKDQYEILLRKIAICKLDKTNIIVLAIYIVVLVTIMIGWLYIKKTPIQYTVVFIGITFLAIILGGTYTYQHFKYKKYKQTLYL